MRHWVGSCLINDVLVLCLVRVSACSCFPPGSLKTQTSEISILSLRVFLQFYSVFELQWLNSSGFSAAWLSEEKHCFLCKLLFLQQSYACFNCVYFSWNIWLDCSLRLKGYSPLEHDINIPTPIFSSVLKRSVIKQMFSSCFTWSWHCRAGCS